jgi:ABC-2 type transport system permease protein
MNELRSQHTATTPGIWATAWLTARYQAPFASTRRGLLPALILLGIPLLIASVSLVKGAFDGGNSFFFEMIHAYYLQFAIGIVMLGLGLGGFPADQANGTLVYLLSRPIPRSGIVLGKTLSICFTGVVLILVSATGTGALLKADLSEIARAWLGLGVASCYYGIIFTVLPLLTRRTAAIGIVYVLPWEGFVSLLPGTVHTLTASYYIRALIPGGASRHPAIAIMTALSETPSTSEAVLRLLITCVVAVAIGIALFRRKEFPLSKTEED